MKSLKKAFILFAALVMLLSLAACKVPTDNTAVSPTPENTIPATATPDAETDEPTETEAPVTDDGTSAPMNYSAGIDENGFWEGVDAHEYVDTFEYAGINIPYATHHVSDEALQAEIDYILDAYKTTATVTDRAVVDGDTVNIDYVGSVDGVEFAGGSTGGAGVDVTIGITAYIDDFLAQIIGHKPGDEFDINVTFPEDYGTDELSGKAAVFKTKVNYIVESVRAELTDEFVMTNLTSYGWTTVAELKDAITEALENSAVTDFIYQHILNVINVKSIPGHVLKHHEDLLVTSYTTYAAQYNMELEPFIQSLGIESVEALVEANALETKNRASFQLAVQLIAEELELKVTDDEISAYFYEMTLNPDFSMYEAVYGRPYVAQGVLSELVSKYVKDNAIFLEE